MAQCATRFMETQEAGQAPVERPRGLDELPDAVDMPFGLRWKGAASRASVAVMGHSRPRRTPIRARPLGTEDPLAERSVRLARVRSLGQH